MEKVAIEACRLGGSPPPLYNNRPEGTRNPTALEKEKKKNSFSLFSSPPSPAPSSHPRLRTDGVCSPLVPPNTGQFPPSSLHCHNSAQKHFGFSFAAAVPLVPKERALSPSLSRVQSRGALQPNPGCCCRRRRGKRKRKEESVAARSQRRADVPRFKEISRKTRTQKDFLEQWETRCDFFLEPKFEGNTLEENSCSQPENYGHQDGVGFAGAAIRHTFPADQSRPR